MKSGARILVMLVTAQAVGCASEPLEFAPWTLPVPEDATVIEHVHVGDDDRDQRIDVQRELVLEGGEEPFYRPIDVDADAAGNVYVFDAGNSNIVAFDASGNYLVTFGREGQGPGEIAGGGRIAVVGPNIVHVSRNRLNAWTPDGEVLESRNLEFARFLLPIAGTDLGHLIGANRGRTQGDVRFHHILRVSPHGDLEHEYAALPDAGYVSLVRRSGSRVSSYNTRIPVPVPTFAVSRDADLYVAAGDEYQVLAFAPDGSLRWALRTSMKRPPLTDERIETSLEGLATVGPDDRPLVPPASASEVDWPAELPALVGRPSAHAYTEPIRVDGHGHLYVYPFIPDSWDRADQPVDVYSRDGERLFSGMMPLLRWDAARDDFVYAVDTDPVTEEYRVVRYRLVEPFD